jgi:hypothetical protein
VGAHSSQRKLKRNDQSGVRARGWMTIITLHQHDNLICVSMKGIGPDVRITREGNPLYDGACGHAQAKAQL